MRRRVCEFGGAAFLALGAACTRGDTRVPGRLATIPGAKLEFAQLAPAGTILYNTYGAGVYALDVTDPRHPKDLGTLSYADGLLCNGEQGCPGFLVRGSKAYLADDKYLAQVSLPSSDYPDWLYQFPTTSAQHYVVSMVPLPSGFAIGGVRQDTIATVPGDLTLVAMTNGTPAVGSIVLNTASTGTFLSADGAQVFYLEDSGLIGQPAPPVPYHRVVIFGASDVAAPSEIARLDLPGVPDGENVYFLAANAHDVVIGALKPMVEELNYLAWYRLAPDEKSLSRVDAVTRWVLGNAQPVISGDYVFVSLGGSEANPFDHSGWRLAVLRLDTSEGLVEESITPLDAFPQTIAVDSSRGLVYVGGYGLEIFDLGVLEGGSPRWP